jgi:hypothetical protein
LLLKPKQVKEADGAIDVGHADHGVEIFGHASLRSPP